MVEKTAAMPCSGASIMATRFDYSIFIDFSHYLLDHVLVAKVKFRSSSLCRRTMKPRSGLRWVFNWVDLVRLQT